MCFFNSVVDRPMSCVKFLLKQLNVVSGIEENIYEEKIQAGRRNKIQPHGMSIIGF